MSSAERQSDHQSREGVAGTLQQTGNDGDYPESDSDDAKYLDRPDGCVGTLVFMRQVLVKGMGQGIHVIDPVVLC